MPINNSIINQKGTPAFFSDIFANRPTYGYAGRVFISTDTGAIYEDTGTSWTLIADAGAGTTGTLQQVTTNGNSTTLPIVVQNMLLSSGAGTGSNNTGFGINALVFNTTGYSSTAIGYQSLQNNTTGYSNTGVGASVMSANTTGIQNTAIGKSSLTSNTTGNSNTAIGTVALGSNTTANYNTAIGTSALSSNTTGSQNIGIGVSALLTNTTADGNLAIGNNSMSSNTTGANNVAVGNSSLNANTTGNSNVAVGIASLQVNTTGGSNNGLGISSLSSNTTGNANNAFGTSSLFYNTTGSQNTAIGNSALQNNISGDSNTAIGNTALNSNTTASQNTAIGNAALSTNTTGTSNTAIGAVALQFSTTSSNNTAIGNGALNKNTTGNNNTAIGYLALQNNTTGIENTAVGLSSLGVNTTGQYNVAFGRSSLNANTVGNFNTAIGSQALANVTTGSQNIVIGYNSGGGITTGNANTIIGTSVTGLSATLSNNIILADGAGNVRLFSDANGLIAINQAVGSTPGGQLDIHTAQTYALVLNGLTTNNAYTAFSNASVGKWRIGNTYNAGANTFDIFNLGTSSTAMSFNATTNNAVFSGNVGANGSPGTNFPLEAYINSATAYTTSSRANVFRCFNSNSAANIFAGIELGGSGPANDGLAGFNAVVTSTGSAALTFYTRESNTFAEKMRITSSGNILVNSTTDDTINKLQVTGSGKFTSYVEGAYFQTASLPATSGGLRLGTQVAIRARNVGNTANIPLIESTASDTVSVASGGAVVIISNLAGTGSRAVLADASGNLSAPVSDISVKENISIIGYGLTEILKMKPVWFNYIDQYKNFGEGRQNGNIAQEMENIIPEAVFTTPSTGKMGINYDQLHAVYIKAIQELKAEIDALKNN